MPTVINFQGKEIKFPATPTLQSLRQPAKYWVISDAQLKRDLKGRTLKDVYRENRTGRDAPASRYVPRYDGNICFPARGYMGKATIAPGSDGGLFGPRAMTIREEYLAWCQARGHEPHPASIDSDHERNCHRFKAPRADIAFVHSVPTPAKDWPMQEAA